MKRSALGGRTRAVSAPSISRSTIIRTCSRFSSAGKAPFEKLVQAHCERIVASSLYRELVVQLDLRFEGRCPIAYENTVLRVIEELLSNSVEHGFDARPSGRVFVQIVSDLDSGVHVSVSDDGWGFETGPIVDLNGFHLLRQLGKLYLGAPAAPFATTAAVTVVIPSLRSQRPRFPSPALRR